MANHAFCVVATVNLLRARSAGPFQYKICSGTSSAHADPAKREKGDARRARGT